MVSWLLSYIYKVHAMHHFILTVAFILGKVNTVYCYSVFSIFGSMIILFRFGFNRNWTLLRVFISMNIIETLSWFVFVTFIPLIFAVLPIFRILAALNKKYNNNNINNNNTTTLILQYQIITLGASAGSWWCHQTCYPQTMSDKKSVSFSLTDNHYRAQFNTVSYFKNTL